MKFFSKSKGAKTSETATPTETPTETPVSTPEVSPSPSTTSIPIAAAIPNFATMSEGELRGRVYDLEREHAQTRAGMFMPKPTSNNRVESWADLSSFQREPLQVPSLINDTSPTPVV